MKKENIVGQETKVISIKEIRQEAKELKSFDGFYNGVPIKEIVVELTEAYKMDGYKIVK